MLNLPASTACDIVIPNGKFLQNPRLSLTLRAAFDEQIESIVWTNKISQSTCPIRPGRHFAEMEVLRINLRNQALDKRALNCIDRAIPYHVFYTQWHGGQVQFWIGDKTFKAGRIRVPNYFRTRWISESDFVFPSLNATVDELYRGCVEQIGKHRPMRGNKRELSADGFAAYCREMLMTYSYKPLLILALIQNGGAADVPTLARYFRKFYRARKVAGQPVERGGCVFSNDTATDAALERNIVVNPVNALMNSGLFSYDGESRVFSIRAEIYDNLTLAQVDAIERICAQRLRHYFSGIEQEDARC
jgi:hypothetical protein